MHVFVSLGRCSENAIKAMLTEPEHRTAAVRQLVERVGVQVDGLEVRLRSKGLASLVAELRQRPIPAEVARSMHADTRLGGGTLVVRFPMRLGWQRGRRRILALDGSELTRPTKP